MNVDRSYPNLRRHTLLARLHIDLPLTVALLLVSGFGLVALYSASDGDIGLFQRQLVRIGMAFAAFFFMAQLSPAFLKRWTPALYVLGVTLLVTVLILGEIGKGAQRWLDLGIIRFQPSEILKVAAPMMVSWYLADRSLPPQLRPTILCALFILVPVGLIMRQPDLGTSLLVGASGAFVLFFAGFRWRYIAAAVGAVMAAAPLMWFFGMHEYQKQRVLTFLNPHSDPLGSGYHIIQSEIAIGSGGLFGKGWLNGTQSHLNFLPEQSTDFIFAVIGEEFGLLGLTVLLLMYLYLIGHGLYIATQAQDTYSRLLAGSLSLTFFVYVFVNAGMVMGLLPVVGLPLPLISYGGTSMVTLMAAFGMLMSIHRHRRMLSD